MQTNELAAPEKIMPINLAEIKRKTKFTGTVVKTTLAGAIVNIGLEVPGVVHISQLQVEPTNRVEDVVQVGQTVDVWVRRVDPKKKRIDLTMIEPLPLEWREITKGLIVKGKVIRTENFGIFVDIGAERPGLVHISEITHGYIKSPTEVVREGDEVEVQVLEVNRRKKQIRLSMKALEKKPEKKKVRKGKPSKPKKSAEELVLIEATPTAMEIALREAMERNNTQTETIETLKKPKNIKAKNNLEDILSRSLQNKVRTSR